MSQWREVARADDIVEGEPFPVMVDDRAVALYRMGDEIHVISDFCTHVPDVRLSGGFVDGDVIECPMHQSRFEIRSGKVLNAPATEDIRHYAVKIEGGRVFIEV